MATINKFEDLDVWKKARILTKEIFKITLSEKFSKDYSLKDQIRRASGSIMDNIAEGFGRGGRKEFIQFLGIAKGSSSEVKSQLYRALDNHYIDDDKFNQLYNEVDEVCKMLNGLISYLNNSEIKGQKFKQSQQSVIGE